jgi:phage shock protein A
LKESNRRNELVPEIQRYEEMIKQMHLHIEEGAKSIQKEEDKNAELT